MKIDKVVNGVETASVKINENFVYTLKVTNTGETTLKNVLVSDIAPEGIQFVSAKTGTTNIPVDGNKISYVIPSLAVKQSVTIEVTAKSTKYSATPVVNTACVNAPEVNPGNPTKNDGCDTASTTTPEPGKVSVCDPSTGDIIQVYETDKDKYEPVDSEKCKVQVCDPSDRIIKTVPKSEAGKYLPANSDKCQEMTVCVIETGELNKVIYKDEFDSAIYSTNENDCKKPVTPEPETPTPPVTPEPETPVVIPATGAEIVGGLAGTSALSYGAYTYLASRRAIRNARK